MPAHSANGRGGKHLALPELPDLQQPVMPVAPFGTPLIDIPGKTTEIKKPEKPVKAHIVLIIYYFTQRQLSFYHL